MENRSQLGDRNLIVLAPEDSGKTTLALLAAANQALAHSRSTLIVCRSKSQAARTFGIFRTAIEPTTLRWNLRLRQADRDLASDLSRAIVPDVVIVSLEELVTRVLDNAEIYAPLLRQVGLVVVDDVESFAGPVEIHAQLAFRRLQLLFRQLIGVEQLGAANAPLLLMLAADTMNDTAAWVRSLCSAKAAVYRYTPDAGGRLAGAPNGTRQLFHLADLVSAGGRNLNPGQVVAACEVLGVPWHYRPCGDGRRHWGRAPLRLDHEPAAASESPRGACVIFLEGKWSEVRRELARLPWAGASSGRAEIALLALVEPEERAACEALRPLLGDPAAGEPPQDLAKELSPCPCRSSGRPPAGWYAAISWPTSCSIGSRWRS